MGIRDVGRVDETALSGNCNFMGVTAAAGQQYRTRAAFGAHLPKSGAAAPRRGKYQVLPVRSPREALDQHPVGRNGPGSACVRTRLPKTSYIDVLPVARVPRKRQSGTVGRNGGRLVLVLGCGQGRP